MEAEHRRVAASGRSYRAHNEAIRESVVAFRALSDVDAVHGFMCECPITDCEDTIELSIVQYEDSRLDPGWFLVKPEHVVPGGAKLVHDRGSHWVVAPG